MRDWASEDVPTLVAELRTKSVAVIAEKDAKAAKKRQLELDEVKRIFDTIIVPDLHSASSVGGRAMTFTCSTQAEAKDVAQIAQQHPYCLTASFGGNCVHFEW